MNADNYNYQKFLTGNKPKVPGLRKPAAFNLGSILGSMTGGRPSEDPAKIAAHSAMDGTATNLDHGYMNRFNPLYMLLRRRG
jgi:hypothetical protein